MARALDRFLLLQPRWLPTVLLIPILYGLGWIEAKSLSFVGLSESRVSLVGTGLSFVMFLLLMPRWASRRWSEHHPWRRLGLRKLQMSHRGNNLASFCGGLLIAKGLLALIVGLICLNGWGHWHGEFSLNDLLNALVLCLGVGLAEELIFRAWLSTELTMLLGPMAGMIGQAGLFSLVHTRFNLGLAAMTGLLSGLLLLGLVLALLRRMQQGSLWGCIGLHGGLVGGWFMLQSGLLDVSAQTPSWIVGPGGLHANPLGSLVGIGALSIIFFIQLLLLSQGRLNGSTP